LNDFITSQMHERVRGQRGNLFVHTSQNLLKREENR
jgi:hypothetical protein